MWVSSALIDDIIKNNDRVNKNVQVQINGDWYIAKPCGGYHVWWRRIIAAWRILIGKSMAVHYKETE